MIMHNVPPLTTDQVTNYQRDGFLVLRGCIPESDIKRLKTGFARNLAVGASTQIFNRGRFTLAKNALKDPDLGFIAEHPVILAAARTLLHDDPCLTAFVIYNRTPGGERLPAHNDYKRWRPVGSSMNWLFAITPMTDFDHRAGPIFVAPGSHRLERVHTTGERVLGVNPPVRPEDCDFIDPELRRGDVLIMNMHMWHKAGANGSEHDRVGVFNKYAAANAPPATGYLLFDDDVHDMLSPEHRSLLAVHSNKPLAKTRIVLRQDGDAPRIFMLQNASGRWCLPGGAAWVERAIPDWDRGNLIAALQGHLREQVRIETPWVSYIGDYPEGEDLCRVYGYTLNGLGFPADYAGGAWFDHEQIAALGTDDAHGYEADAFARWLDPGPVRGKGLSQAQCRVDQYAY